MHQTACHTETDSSFDFVQEAVWRQAELTPGRAALVDEGGTTIDYRSLARRSSLLAEKLRSLSVGPDVRVAVWLDRSIESIVSMLAVLEAGGTYVPIDLTYPLERVGLMLANSGASVLISERDVPPEFLPERMTVLTPGKETGSLPKTSASPGPLLDSNLAYVIYTSGSTGAPKAIAMTHRGLTRLIRWQIQSGPPALSTLHFTPACFDVTFQEVCSTLCTGGTLWLVSDDVRRNSDRLLLFLRDNSIQRLFLPYVALLQLAKASERLGIVPKDLRHVITAGERLVVTEAISRLFAALPACRLDNHYGPTEAHLVTSWTLSSNPSEWPALPPIGKAVEGSATYVLDSRCVPVGAGETGELYVGGDGLARGYLCAPDLTAERFLPDPFASIPGERMYRTGDLVQSGNADGPLEFLGRSDDQLKVRGFRVEPGEVERALTEHPCVRQAAVGLRGITPDIDALVAYIVTTNAVAPAELSQHLRSRLPDYMAPSRFVFLDCLPLTSSGKVDRRQLSQIRIPTLSLDVPSHAGSVLDTVRAIWGRVLGTDIIEPDDDFFDVGGDSLLATWMVTELSQSLGHTIELSVFLSDSTLSGLVRTLEGLDPYSVRKRRVSELVTLRPGPPQRVLYFVHPLGGELLAYRDLATAIRSPLRVLGLRWQPEESWPPLSLSLEQMAEFHVLHLRSIQAAGPFLLAGWSFGGALAYEIAQQIVAAGERVDFLGLLDANPVRDPLTGVLTREIGAVDSLSRLLDRLNRDLSESEEAEVLDAIRADSYLSSLLGTAIPEGVTATHLRRNLLIARDSIFAAINYRPVPYTGAVDLFQAEETSSAIRGSLEIELRRLARGPFRLHTVPGSHYSMLRAPLVESLAQSLDRAVQQISAH